MAGVEVPDWLRVILLAGKSGSEFIPVAVDANGNMYILMQGTDGVNLQPVKLDSEGRIIGTLLDPASGYYLAVDANGFLTAVMKGADGATLRSIKVDSSGRMIGTLIDPATGNYIGIDGNGYIVAKMVGHNALGQLVNILCDAGGQLVMVPRGQSGYYMNVDASGYLTTVLKGIFGADLKTVQVDTNGNMIAVVKDPTSGNVISIDVNGFLTAVMKGLDGETLRSIKVDADGRMIGTLIDPASGYYLAVDANGFLTAVLKGSDAGTLRTIAVDDAGRMIGLIADPTGNFGNIDYVGLAELAGRLGGLQRWDTRGRLLRGLSFDEGRVGQLICQTFGSSSVALNPIYFESGGYSLKMSITNGSTDLIYADMTIVLGQSLKLGFELAFLPYPKNAIVDLTFFYYHGTTLKQAGLRWDTYADKLYYIKSDSTWAEIPGGGFPVASQGAFNHMKFVVDFSTGKYLRAMANDYSVDLSALSCYATTSTALNALTARLSIDASGSLASDVYADNLVVTYSEPDN